MPSKQKQQDFPPIEEYLTAQMPVEKLVPYAGNPRRNDHAVDQMAGLLKRFGFRIPVLAKSDGQLIDGHLRIKAANKLGLETVPAILCDDMSENDIKALRLSVNRAAELAEWDMDLLKVELEELTDAGFDLEEIAFDMGLLDYDPVGDSEKSDHIDDTYTSKIKAPIYEPKGEKPEIKEMIDRTKTDSLITEVKAAKLAKPLERFLIDAAERHTVFKFRQIAEYYCHAPKEVQDLFEKSGLVIIDFNKAIEYGFVHLTERLGKLADMGQQEGDEEDEG